MNMNLTTLLDFLDIIGTIAFAISGAVLSMQKRFYLFGVLFISCIPATGGGILRDVLLGNTPPAALAHPSNTVLALAVGALTFLLAGRIARRRERLFLYSDALGLGVFTAIGASKALLVPDHNLLLAVATGLLTGVGGGMLRDIMAKPVPFVLRKEVYATACVVGACAFYFSAP